VDVAEPEPAATPEAGWAERLSEMEGWYRDLMSAGYDAAESEVDYWYRPHAAYLASLRGRVIDLGGGVGLAGRYLAPECEHVVVDPAQFWKQPQWREFGARFAQGRVPTFVDARGEELPFEDSSFDAAISYASLNHVEDAERCLGELGRVIRPGGRLLLVLEEMEPTWRDVGEGAMKRAKWRLGLTAGRPRLWHHGTIGGLKDTVRQKLSAAPWPVEPDHVRIEEADLRRWLAPRFDVICREWRGEQLTFELVKAR
jgi:ubiquinone/menaquinone biosynthesis C-methylase UbiE